MEYLIFGSIIIIAIVLVVKHLNKQRLRAKIEEFRSEWGKPKTESFHFVSIGRYADVVKEKFHRLTDQTIEDIDLRALFMFIDRTTSKVGQQFLYKRVIEPTDQITDPSEQFVQLFAKDNALREEIQAELYKLSDPDAYFISSLLRDRFLVAEPKWLKLLTLDIIVVVGLVLLAFKFPALL